MSDENLNVAASESPSGMEPTQYTSSSNFVDTLPADLRDNPSLRSFKSVEDLAKSYVNANSMIGRSVRIPTSEAGPEQMNEFYSKLEQIPGIMRFDPDNPEAVYNRLGRPESPDKYQVTPDPKYSELVDNNQLNDFLQHAHQLGLSNKQAEALVNYQASMSAKQVESYNQQYSVGEQALKEAWGQQYEARLGATKETIDVLSQKYPGLKAVVNVPEVANNPDVIRMLYDMGVAVKEDKSVLGVVKPQFGISPSEAQQKIDEIRMNSSHPFNQWSHPEHDKAVEQMNKLYEIKLGV